jgi:hypothetical protein
MWEGSWPTLLILGIVLSLCLMGNANWPDQWVIPRRQLSPAELEALRLHTKNVISIQDFLLFLLAAAFLSIKSTIMWKRMGPQVDYLTVSLIAVNMLFANLYLLLVIASLFPYWFETHADTRYWVTTVLRYLLLTAIIWGGWALLNVPPPNRSQDHATSDDRQTPRPPTHNRPTHRTSTHEYSGARSEGPGFPLTAPSLVRGRRGGRRERYQPNPLGDC